MELGCGFCSKRLERGRLSWPAEGDENGKVQLSYEELALLVGGIELGRTRRKNLVWARGIFESRKCGRKCWKITKDFVS